ncbi:hypothetical protein NBRC111894_3286 [Sporolactobacillus inulinus]|uniref:Uncharacterized protein n=1 Tax=Sporolactobacillus inulinus TaxID=2078 RepID=A0A4Y1ZEW6_9BACL|nr:hypothetical protein NBRC111894_3286 [Sporolactobacillus inulinus]
MRQKIYLFDSLRRTFDSRMRKMEIKSVTEAPEFAILIYNSTTSQR